MKIRTKPAAKILGVSTNTLRKWVRRGLVPYEVTAYGLQFDTEALAAAQVRGINRPRMGRPVWKHLANTPQVQ